MMRLKKKLHQAGLTCLELSKTQTSLGKKGDQLSPEIKKHQCGWVWGSGANSAPQPPVRHPALPVVVTGCPLTQLWTSLPGVPAKAPEQGLTGQPGHMSIWGPIMLWPRGGEALISGACRTCPS